jgi:phosphoglycerate dehydrogenase-like enzyme
MKQILVTDSLFIFPEHEQQLREAGFEVVRLDKPEASEKELCEGVKGKVGYILGGIEKVTNTVIDAADVLEAIVFTGIDYKGFIPGWERALARGVSISSVPDGPTQPVAEWAVTAALAMNRGIFDLGSPDGKTLMTTPGLASQTIGIIGLGRIGGRIAEIVQSFYPLATLYYSTHRHEDQEGRLSLQYKDMNTLLSQSDVVFLCVPDEAGASFFNTKHFASMKRGALLVSFMHPGIVDVNALYEALDFGRVRAISDYPMDERFSKFPKSVFYSFKASNAFNTKQSLQFTSDKATQILIEQLSKK